VAHLIGLEVVYIGGPRCRSLTFSAGTGPPSVQPAKAYYKGYEDDYGVGGSAVIGCGVEDVRAKYIHRTTAIAIATFGTMCPLLGSLLSVMGNERGGRELFGMSSGNASRGATARAGDSGVAERMATIRVASMTSTGEAESKGERRRTRCA
jgi:hypothetical protein